MIVLPGPASQELGKRLAAELHVGTIPLLFKRFPDGENYVRIGADLRGEEVAIVQTTSPPQDQKMMQLFLLSSAAKAQGARKIIAIVPYFAYNRQDQIFLPGEALSAQIIIKLLKACGVDKIVTVNAHNPVVLNSFSLPVEDLSAVSLLAEHFRHKGLQGAVSLSLGKKGLNMAKEAAAILQGEYEYISTRRNRQTGEVSIEEKAVKLQGETVIFFDDIISSGGTMAKAVAYAKKQGAAEIYAACVHPLLVGTATENILQNGANYILGTDSISSSIKVVSIAPLIAQALR